MLHLPFNQPGRFWKGNLHTHCTASDGLYSAEAVCQRYREAGYDFMAMTDHFMEKYNFPLTDTRAFRTDDFTTLIGAELHTGRIELGDTWHILAVGLPLDFAPTQVDESAAHLAARALATGAYVALAHPAWYVLTERDVAAIGKVDAVEIINGTAIDHNDRADSWHLADILLGRGERYFVCATDDFHGKAERHDFARGWVQVKSESLEPTALLTALKNGHYYASTGPEIYDIQVTPGEKVTVRCSPAERVFATGIGSKSVAVGGYINNQYVLNLQNFPSPYCRITVRDSQGGRAWSNPIWFE